MQELLSATPTSTATDRAGKYILFRLDREEYGVPVLKVREIVGYQEAVSVPHTPSFVKGVINLRGKVIPIMDLRERFNLARNEITAKSSIIIVQIQETLPPVLIGIVVDEVLEVVDIRANDIEDTPDFGHNIDSSYILGVAKTESKVRMLLKAEKALAFDYKGARVA